MKIVSLFAAAAMLGLTGCSVFMAAKQPPKKDLGVLNVGTARGMVLAELGQPVAAETRDGAKVDVFSFTQGYSKPAKAGRALFHGAADIFTLGLWEVVGTPTEAVFDGSKMALEVAYDENDRVAKVVNLQADQQAALAAVAAAEAERKKAEEPPTRVATSNFSSRSQETDTASE